MRILMVMIGLVLSPPLAACNGPNASVGGVCRDDGDCNDRCLEDWPGGYCTLECRDNRDCPSDTVCVDTKGGVCLLLCENSNECKDLLGDNDFVCRERKDRRDDRWDVCVPD